MKKSSKIKRISWFFIALFITILINLPVLMVIYNSFRTNSAFMMKLSLSESPFTFSNYIFVFKEAGMARMITNSLFISGTSTFVTTIIGAMAGYILSRFNYRFITFYSFFLLMMQMFPLILSLIPLFLLFKNMGILNTAFSVIIIYLTTNLTFSTWMFKGYFDSIPKELEEAALIDGASKTQIFILIILPLSKIGAIAVAIFTFVMCWNEFLVANLFLRQSDIMTVPVGMQMFIQQYSTQYGQEFAASTVAMVPGIIILIFFQKYIVSGITAGSVKG